MDQCLLHAVASEASHRLLEQEIVRVSHLGRCRYLLRFATPRRDNLLLSARPDLARFHLSASRRVPEEPPDRFAALLDQELSGAVLETLVKRPWDRVVEMRFRLPRRDDAARERRLVHEILGRSSNLLLLDATGVILGYCRDLRSEFRSPAVGREYRPPPGRDDIAALPEGPEALPHVRGLPGGAAEFLRRISPLLAADVGRSREDPERRLIEVLEAIRSGRWSPVVYSARPLDQVTEGDAPEAESILVSPLPLLSPPGRSRAGEAGPAVLFATPFSSPSGAAEAGLGLLERLRDFKDLKDHHEAIVRREIERLESLQGKLEEELRRAKGSERHRLLGEALLAGLSQARVERGTALVPDPYEPSGPELEVPIDPALPLQENARLLFERYKKGKRGVATIETRLAAVRRRLAEWRALGPRAAAVRDPRDLDRLREAMSGLGLVHAPRPPKPGRPQRPKEAPARVRSYTSPDGLTILVGKSSEENDILTFRVASPWDFWLHAAGRKGAHVVVRNPRRLKSLPERSLRAAAEIAAFHSGARREAKVEVHYTQRKHVHRRKGMPSGQVLLRRFRAIQVAPRLPSSTVEEV